MPLPRDPRHLRGESAERLAERHLVGEGLQILARNFRCRAGELDLICLNVAGPLESVNAAKRRRIRRATEFFRLGAPQWRHLRVRFDVVAVQGAPDDEDAIDWVKDAFT